MSQRFNGLDLVAWKLVDEEKSCVLTRSDDRAAAAIIKMTHVVTFTTFSAYYKLLIDDWKFEVVSLNTADWICDEFNFDWRE